MEARIHYKKLMLYHHIIHSDERRVIKKVIIEQKNSLRKGTWYHGVTQLITKYNIKENAEEVLKSAWKRIVKKQIKDIKEKEIKSNCKGRSKSRSVVDDDYTMKEYKRVLKMRMHMVNIPCNFNHGEQVRCWLCGMENVKSEHYFECLEITNTRKCWNTKKEDITSQNEEHSVPIWQIDNVIKHY